MRTSKEMKERIREELQTKSVPDVARTLGCDYMAVYRVAEKDGISRRACTKFSKEEDEFIAKWYGIMRAGEIAKRLNMDKRTIYYRRRVLGLGKTCRK